MFLQEQTLKYPMSRVCAERAGQLWSHLLDRLDESDRFSAGFWFLEQLGGGSAAKDLGMVQCFQAIYFHHTASVLKERLKHCLIV